MALALEGTPVHANTGGTNFSWVIGPFTTSQPALIVIAVLTNESGTTTVTGGGLTFGLRTRGPSGAGAIHVEIWTASAASALSAVSFTVTTAANSFASADIFAISGGDTSTIYDNNASIPANGATDPLTISTTNTNDFIIGAFRFNSTASPTQGSGWTKISGADYLLTEYKIVSATQTNLSVNVGTGVGDSNGAVADAVMQAVPPPVLDEDGEWIIPIQSW